MPTETQTATAVETPAQEWSRFTDQSLSEVFGETPESPKDEVTPEPAKTEPVAQEPAKVEVKAETPVDDAFASLDALLAKDTSTPEPEKAVETPKATSPQIPEIQQIEQWKNDPQLAKDAVNYASQGYALNEAFKSGDMAKVQAQFDERAWNEVVNHVWETRKDELIQRAIDEQNGVKHDPRTDLLVREINTLKSKLTEREQRELQDKQHQEQSRQITDRQNRFNQTWKELFDVVKVSDEQSQRFLRGAVMDAVSSDPKKVAQISQGNFKELRLAFRDVYKTWIDLKKQADLAVTGTREKQESKKSGQLVTSSTGDSQSEPADFDEDGRRTKSFWQKSLASLGLDK